MVKGQLIMSGVGALQTVGVIGVPPTHDCADRRHDSDQPQGYGGRGEESVHSAIAQRIFADCRYDRHHHKDDGCLDVVSAICRERHTGTADGVGHAEVSLEEIAQHPTTTERGFLRLARSCAHFARNTGLIGSRVMRLADHGSDRST